MSMDQLTIDNSNQILKEKTEQIWKLFDETNPKFIIHICSNFDKGLQEQEKDRFNRMLSQYSNIEIAKYDVKYADSNSDFIIQEDITDNDCNVIKSIITVKYPFENVNGCYVRKVVNYATNDRDINEKVKNIIHSRPEHIKELINVVDETYTYEVTENIDMQNNDTEITITYSHITDTYWDKIKKSSEEKKNEYVLSFVSAITAGAVGSIFLIPAYDPIVKENAYLNEKIKILKKRRKRNN